MVDRGQHREELVREVAVGGQTDLGSRVRQVWGIVAAPSTNATWLKTCWSVSHRRATCWLTRDSLAPCSPLPGALPSSSCPPRAGGAVHPQVDTRTDIVRSAGNAPHPAPRLTRPRQLCQLLKCCHIGMVHDVADLLPARGRQAARSASTSSRRGRRGA